MQHIITFKREWKSIGYFTKEIWHHLVTKFIWEFDYPNFGCVCSTAFDICFDYSVCILSRLHCIVIPSKPYFTSWYFSKAAAIYINRFCEVATYFTKNLLVMCYVCCVLYDVSTTLQYFVWIFNIIASSQSL